MKKRSWRECVAGGSWPLLVTLCLAGCGVPPVPEQATAELTATQNRAHNTCGTPFSIGGAIGAKYVQLGNCSGFLGVPTTSEKGTPDGVGRYNHFYASWDPFSAFDPPGSNLAANGSIYWTPWTGAWSVHGEIRVTWANIGWEEGELGYPISDEYDCNGNRCSDFEFGTILWDGFGAQILPAKYKYTRGKCKCASGSVEECAINPPSKNHDVCTEAVKCACQKCIDKGNPPGQNKGDGCDHL